MDLQYDGRKPEPPYPILEDNASNKDKMTRGEVEAFFSADDHFHALMRHLVANQKVQFIKELRGLTGDNLLPCKETADRIWDSFEGAFEESRKMARVMVRDDLRVQLHALAEMFR